MTQQLNELEIINLYTQNISTHELAKRFNTYPNKINRILRKNGIEIKSRSEAQKTALANGIRQHPTKGKQMSDNVKSKIGQATYTRWKNMPQNERKRLSEIAKKQWNEMSEQERANFAKAAAAGVRKASVEGSKIEKMLLDKLHQNNYNVLFHSKQLMANTELELDFFLPGYKTVIEIDGPTHFEPIWGEFALQKMIRADAQKSGLILAQGMVLIRVKYMSKTTSKVVVDTLYDMIVKELIKIGSLFPEPGHRLIELEIK